jgi:hypothetical protein
MRDPSTTNEVNVGGTLNVVLAASDHGVRQAIAESSSAVIRYGRHASERDPTPETVVPPTRSQLSGGAGFHGCAWRLRPGDDRASPLRRVRGRRRFPIRLRRSDPEVHSPAVVRCDADERRRRNHLARFHPRRERRAREFCAPRTLTAEPATSSTWRWAPAAYSPSLSRPMARCSTGPSPRPNATSRRRDRDLRRRYGGERVARRFVSAGASLLCAS